MAKEIVPHKLVVTYNPDGSVKKAIQQYKIVEDGVTDNKFYTLDVKNALYDTEEKVDRIHAVMEDSVAMVDVVENPEKGVKDEGIKH